MTNDRIAPQRADPIVGHDGGGEPPPPAPPAPPRGKAHRAMSWLSAPRRAAVAKRFKRAFEYRALAVIMYTQALLAVGIAALPFTLGTAKRYTLPALALYLVLVVVFDWLLARQIDSPYGVKTGTVLSRIMKIGVACLVVIPMLVAWALIIRASDSQITLMMLVALAIVGFGWLFWRAASGAYRAGRAPWVSFGTALIVVPLVLSWTLGSLIWSLWVGYLDRDSAWARLPRATLATMAANPERASLPNCDGHAAAWRVAGAPMRVAVALSGGGYRAAVTHAGLLAALDARCVPIEYLTTVSGGSIVGTNYALGQRPQDFAARLADGKPGLPNDMLHIGAMVLDWFSQSVNSADTYTSHFQRVYFAKATLAHLKRRPFLLINATDLRGEGETAREVFFKGRAPGLDDSTFLAELVAASGAFPGAFQPKRLAWPSPGEPVGFRGKPDERGFIDGGVVENLGVAGLRRYLTFPSSPPPPRPHVLVISDASRYAGRANFRSKLELLSLLSRGEEISWDALHRHIYARYTRDPNYLETVADKAVALQVTSVAYEDILDRRVAGLPNYLLTVIVPVTAEATAVLMKQSYAQCAFDQNTSGAEVQTQVAGYPTLGELNREQVIKAFWLGYALGEIYRAAIDCARAVAAAVACEGWSQPPAPACPSRATVMAMLKLE